MVEKDITGHDDKLGFLMAQLPDSLVFYKRTPTFTQLTVPVGLLKEHRTKAGTWGVLRIERGALNYHVTETDVPHMHALSPHINGVIVPEQGHYIEMVGDVEFYVEFYR